MRKVIVATFVVFAALSFVSGDAFGQAANPTDSTSKTAEQLARENLEAFRAWRKEIPDYEKRLYDRVKRINKRTVRIQ